MHCHLCPNEAIDEAEFECGPGANYAVSIPLCEKHFEELEELGVDFDTKYADIIHEEWAESLRGYADRLRDAAKYQ